jgi:hemolysin activation/secretion protein
MARLSTISVALLGVPFLLGAVAARAASSSPQQTTRKDDAAETPKFDVTEFRVLGNTVLPVRDVERTIYPFLGPGRTIADVQSARAALEGLYHQRGFGTVYVDIPEQDVEAGIVRLKVTEARLATVHTAGARYFSERQIRAAVPEAQAGIVPSIPRLQSELAEVNAATRDRSVTPVLKAGAIPGTVDLSLRVEDQSPLHAGLELNNQYTVDTTPLRGLATLSYDNLFGRFDSASLQYQFSPQNTKEVSVLVANYLAHFGSDRLAFYYLHSDSNVATLSSSGGGQSAGSLAVVGRGDAGGLRWIAPLASTPASSQTLSFALEYKDFLQSIGLQGGVTSGQSTGSLLTPVHYADASLAYGGLWPTGRLQRSLDLSATVGIRDLSSNGAEFDDKRYQARPNFFYLRTALSLGTTIPRDFTVIWKVAAQYAPEAIVSNEQFAIAGSDGVRGYLEAEVLADQGAKTSLQLGSPRLALFSERLDYNAFAFFDIGVAHLVDSLPSEQATTVLRSWGLGINLSMFKFLTGSLTWADPLASGPVTRSGDSLFLFSVRSGW